MWPWTGKVNLCVILGHRLSTKRCDVVLRVLLFTSLLSPCCILALSVVPCWPSLRASACQCPLAGAVPSWAVQLEWWGQDVGAAPVPAAPSHRKVSTGCSHICWRGDVSAASPVACGLLPLQLRQSRGALSCAPPVPPWEDERAWGCSRGGDYILLCSVWEQCPAAQKGHSSGW